MSIPLFPFDNTQAKLPEQYYARISPTPVARPDLIKLNAELAIELGLDADSLLADSAIQAFAGNEILAGSEPLALAYAGHQFGHLAPQLGDGRAILLGEILAPDNKRYDIQLKGSGPTPFSRGGDGRSALGPVLREYLLSETMYKLGLPTTRALAAVSTGEEVARDRILPGAILTRVARGYVRVGTFQYFAIREDLESVRMLADYVIARNYPDIADQELPYPALLASVVERQAKLIAQWMCIGFIHGVMNTDNMSIAGETIDYGPCAFMDEFNFNRVYSSIDQQGRYAYNNQPIIGQWNLVRFAETLLPLLAEGQQAVKIAESILQDYQKHYETYWLEGMRNKLGLEIEHADDKALVEDLLQCMNDNAADFTLSFFQLSQLDAEQTEKDKAFKALFKQEYSIENWLSKWRQRLQQESRNDLLRQQAMQTVNPLYIPRNHQVEAAIRAAEDHDDFSVFEALYEVLQKPYEMQKGKELYMQGPKPEEVVHRTFCGT